MHLLSQHHDILFCVLIEHHCSRLHTAPAEFIEEIQTVPSHPHGYLRPPPPTPFLLCHTLQRPSPLFHNVVRSCGSSPMRATRTFLGYILRKMFATPALIQNLHVAQKKVGWGEAKSGVRWHPECFDLNFLAVLVKSSFIFLVFVSAKEADRSNFKPKLLVWVSKVSQHDIHDWNLVDYGSINLQHSLSVALPRLQ